VLIRQRTIGRAAATTVLAIVAVAAWASPAGAVPTIRERQWYLDALHIPAAHAISTGKGVIVGVVDSGIDATQPDLVGQVLPGTAIGAGKSGDGRSDKHGHGTAMGSLIAGKGGGPNRLLGVAPGAKLLPIDYAQENGHTHQSMADAIRWAADHGASVINISETVVLAKAASSQVTAAVRYAMSKDVVVVAGAGNSTAGGDWVTPPATIPGIIAVGGVTQSGEFWASSGHGKELVLAAPAREIVSADVSAAATTGYGIGSGTSASTALVSGVAALIRSKYPDLDAANVVNRLISTAQDKGPKGRDDRFGFGIVDAAAALAPGVPLVKAYPLATSNPDDAPPTTPDSDSAARKLGWIAAGLCSVGAGILVLVGVVFAVIALRRRRRRA
jgi:type VII secretion-associated serine protease mycosin